MGLLPSSLAFCLYVEVCYAFSPHRCFMRLTSRLFRWPWDDHRCLRWNQSSRASCSQTRTTKRCKHYHPPDLGCLLTWLEVRWVERYLEKWRWRSRYQVWGIRQNKLASGTKSLTSTSLDVTDSVWCSCSRRQIWYQTRSLARTSMCFLFDEHKQC